MIDTFQAKPKGKKLIVVQKGMTTLIGEPQGNGKKPKLIDMAFGNPHLILQDLRGQGYEVSIKR